jgi:hypothetical protein
MIFDLLKSVITAKREINVKELPSMGLFYQDDFKIKIKRVDDSDIADYEKDFEKSLGVIVNKIKKVVYNNIFFSNGYDFGDLRSIDVVYIFLEIVKFTLNKTIDLTYSNGIADKKIQFCSKYFNYYRINSDMMSKYDSIQKCFLIDGYKYTLPTIGVESCLSNFLVDKSYNEDAPKYNEYHYDFIYFLLHKKNISFEEIDNLIQIFNFDLSEEESQKITNIIKTFIPMQMYSLIDDGFVVDINSKIELDKIWKKD